ncbi:MAG: DUF2812 domain-containing protein [Clostridiales bacterium]|nr:DUF2812 domain-containing protein [Clostridiales bacterium]MBQ4216963.1 DUF2812 domain-containing protein [Clostridiales bacterium]
MRRVFHKLFFVWELEKEQAWINEMASHGYSLEHAGRLTFVFDETEAGKYTYKTLILKGHSGSSENIKYFKFLEEMGIKVVCCVNYPGVCWVYTRALTEEYPEGIEVYSDIDSTIDSLKISGGYLIFVVLFTLSAAALNLWVSLGGTGSFSPINLVCGVFLLCLCTAATVSAIKTYIKISKLKKERAIHE